MQTLVGYFPNAEQARDAKKALKDRGYDDVRVIDQTGSDYQTGYESTNPEHETLGGKIKHFFSGLSGGDEETYNGYTRAVGQGGAMVTLSVDDDRASDAADLLDRQGATEIDGDTEGSAAGYASSRDAGIGRSGQGVYDAGDRNYGTGTGSVFADSGRGSSDDTAPSSYGTRGEQDSRSDEQVIPVMQEDLNVGKRQVSRGGVRVYSHLVSEPRTENVTLHDEDVVVNRRPVDRAATDADFAMGDRTVELTATGEEAVVGKTSRVVEEVIVGKRGSDHIEQVTDNVRHTEVDVERVGSDTSLPGSEKSRS